MKTIILAGGSGTRLWPLSREYFPKQFLKLENLENKSLFQLTFLRALKISNLNEIFIVTNEKQKFLVMGNIEELGFNDFNEENILVEPEAKNTFPAILYGMSKVEDSALILASDHLISDDFNFISQVEIANYLSKNSLVTFGIKPSSAHTGYGYIKYSGHNVEEFKEKPKLELAKEYVENGYLWNSGMFLFNKKFLEKELTNLNSDYLSAMNSNDIIEMYNLLPNNSVDFELLENCNSISVVPLNISWTDLGSFDSMHDEFEKDLNQNVGSKDTLFKNSKNNFVQGINNKLINILGVDNLIVIDTDDSLLICKRNDSQAIKEVVTELKKKRDERVNFHTKVYRPWGSFTNLEENNEYKVKRLVVLPNKSLSLQLHHKRSEHWVVVEGEALVTKGEEKFNLIKNEGIYIPKETKHRLENRTEKPLIVIETQSGDYLGEDDIVRFDDKYGRQ